MRLREILWMMLGIRRVAAAAEDSSQRVTVSRFFDRARAALECNVCKVREVVGFSPVPVLPHLTPFFILLPCDDHVVGVRWGLSGELLRCVYERPLSFNAWYRRMGSQGLSSRGRSFQLGINLQASLDQTV